MTENQPEPGPSLSKEPQATPPPPPPAAPSGGTAGGSQVPPQGGYHQPQGGYGQPQGGYQQPGPAGAGAPLSPSDERMWAMLGHLGGIVLGFVAPLIVWLVFKDRSRFVDDQGKESLNFQITVAIALVVASILTAVVIGVVLLPVIGVVNLILCIIAGLAANKGEQYRYPFALRLVK